MSCVCVCVRVRIYVCARLCFYVYVCVRMYVRACVTCRRVRECVRPSVCTVCASGDGATGV